MKMIQTDRTFGRVSHEIFYDGQVSVDYSNGTYGVVTIPSSKEHWSNDLLFRGYEFVDENEAVEQKEDTIEENVTEEVQAPTPKTSSGGRKRAKNG